MTKIVLKLFDAAWFYVEKEQAPAQIGPLLILSPPVGAAASFIGDFVEQWRQCKTFAAPFNYRLRRYPIPAWEVIDDDRIDLDYHLRHLALPAPGGERELGVLISRLHSHRLDQRRPLWECHVIEGLEGGRFAIYMKFHHGQLDGVGAARLIGRIFTPDRDARLLLPPWAVGMRGNSSATGETIATRTKTSTTRTNVGTWAGLRDTLGATSTAITAVARMMWQIKSGRQPALAGPFQAPMTIFNGRIGGQWRFATQHYALDRFKRVARAAEVTVNDVFLSIIGDAMRRYLQDLDALPKDSVVGQIPVSIRKTGDTSVGNAIAFIYARLHTDIEDPLDRLNAVHASLAAAKSVHEALPAASVTPFTMLLVGPYMAQVILGLGGYLPPAANLVVSNVPGPTERLYFNGARVDEIYGPSVLFHGQALNITMSSYAGQADIGYTACRDSMPSMQKLAVYTGQALDELESRLGIAGSDAIDEEAING